MSGENCHKCLAMFYLLLKLLLLLSLQRNKFRTMNTYPHKQICYLSWLHKVTNHDILSAMYLLHAMSSGMTQLPI